MDESSLAYSSLGVFLWGTAQLYSTTCLFLIQGLSWRQRFWRGTCTHSWDEWKSTPRPSAPIHPRPSSVISCDSELSRLQTGWSIDQFNQTYVWKSCKTFALSLPVRQLSWQEESFFSTYHPSLLAVFSLDVFVLFFHLSSTNHWKASALTQREKSRCVVLLKAPMLTMLGAQNMSCPLWGTETFSFDSEHWHQKTHSRDPGQPLHSNHGACGGLLAHWARPYPWRT